MPPAVWLWAVKWCRQKPIDLLQADRDWVVPGKDILYSQTGGCSQANTFGACSIIQHGIQFTAITGNAASHHVA